MNTLKPLKIGHFTLDPPFMLGGMGVRTSDHALAAAVANCGMAGTIASVGLVDCQCRGEEYVRLSNAGLVEEIRLARELSNGVIGVNVMVALTNYEDLVKTAVAEKVDYIVSGAGLPLALPALAEGTDVALIPIASSGRTADMICKRWLGKYNRLPDAIVVEGALAGGHLGFTMEEAVKWDGNTLQSVVAEVVSVAKEYEARTGRHIPVIAAGGVYGGQEIARVMAAGAEGVQMATRFIATDECSLPRNCKQLLLDSTEEDMVIIKSPVGMPGRAVRNDLVNRAERGEKTPLVCNYHCLKTCKPNEVLFCIAQALVGAHDGDEKNGLLMAGYNAYRLNEILPVRELVDRLIEETEEAMNQ